MDFLQSGCDNEELGSGLPLNLSFVGNNDFFLDDQMVNHPFQVGEVAEQIENPCPGFGHDQVYVPLLPVSGPVPLVDDQQQSLYLLDIDTEEAIDDKITEASECVMQTVEPEDPTLDIDPYIKELTKSLLDDDEEDPLKGNDSNQQNTAPTTEHVARECQKDAVSGCGVHNNDLSTKHDWNLNPEYCDGVVVCSINRESDEIPENDHVPSEPQNPKARKSSHTSSGEILATKKLGKPSFPPQRAKSRAKNLEINPTNNGSSNRNVECLRMACKSTGFPPSTFHDKVTMMENPAVAINRDEKLEEDPLRDRQTQNAVNDANASAMGPEDDSVESDDDYLPCSISVEAMILDMDLAPAVQDLYESEVAKYQNEDVRRAIIRLEQSARSHMERELVSRGALAILYGENSRYYIKKPEVLLGRATGEYPIDIDLGKSGTITKVSRRQALISLKNDGSFYIKNLGKFPISVNGEEFGYGTVKKLKNDALIEIREMAFIFETSKTCVKRYLESKDNPNNP
ncbi:PREDICTED: uncharacterized protein LOC104813234 [Tarenaya hassleriana]|uniref:uncharacterized protein LOC104813234 n=1 Tax=Tarenaya hassleriana TaxID=28532 RepID=UPI0008FD244E|nr:PREDICTED: uncharacterized protein LOC104813234 [Tarenaya hassleriana]